MPRSDLYEGSYTGRRDRGAVLRLLGWIAGTIALIGGLFFAGEFVQRYVAYTSARSGHGELREVTPLAPARNIILNTRSELPSPVSDARLLASGLPVYELRIAPDDLRVLQLAAERVTSRSISTGVAREYVGAGFSDGTGWRPVKVKLRGLYDTHYLKKRPSLRIKFPPDRPFEGMRQINLSDPYDKGLTVDVTTNWELRSHGLLTWDSRFVVLRVNSEVVGLFQEIEQFGPSMADRNGRPEGFIYSGYGQLFGKQGSDLDKARLAIGRLGECHGLDGRPIAEHCDWEFVRATTDVDRWAWAAALAALLHSSHAWHPDNLRVFWDPARGRFEPIPWDYAYYPIDLGLTPEGETPRGYAATFNGLPDFRRMRDTRLFWLLSERVEPMIEHADALFEELALPLDADNRHPDLELDRERQRSYGRVLRANRDALRDLFERADLRAEVWTSDGAAVSDGAVVVALANHAKAFVRVEALALSSGDRVPLRDAVLVDGLWRGEPGRARLRAALPEGARVVSLVARNEVAGTPLRAESVSVTAGSGPPPEVRKAAAAPALEVALDNVAVEAGRVVFGPGRVRLARTLELPRDVDAVFAPGLELEMARGASLLIYGDLESRGRAEAPVRVFGASPRWGGVAVQGTRTEPSRVHLEHTRFEGGTGSENERTYFTAPFAVHDGVVTLHRSEFLDSAADDAINLKYSEVDVRENLFAGSVDDAFDCDFCTGEVVANRMERSGGDGLDFSGSNVRVVENTIVECGDKGLSIGERTTAVLENNDVSDCRTGIAVKDLSRASIRGGRLERLEVGVALYVKKLSFGPSRARLEGVDMRDVGSRVVSEDSCVVEDASAPLEDASGARKDSG